MSGGIQLTAPADLAVRKIEMYIQRRDSTDRRMGSVWMIVPFLPIAAVLVLVIGFIGIILSVLPQFREPNVTDVAAARTFAGIFALYGFAFLTIYVVMLIGAFAIFYFLDRRNKHFTRQQMLFAAISSYFISRGRLISQNVGDLAQLSEASVLEEEHRSAGLWAILYVFVTPIIGLLAAYNLTQDLRKHEERQLAFQSTLASAFEESELQRPTFPPCRSHSRDPMTYLIVTAITAGLFWIYWFYVLLKDYNEHFEDQAVFENQLLTIVKPSAVCKSCGGSVPYGAKFCPLCGTAMAQPTT